MTFYHRERNRYSKFLSLSFFKSRYSRCISSEAVCTSAHKHICKLDHWRAVTLKFSHKYRKCNSGSWSKTYSQCAHEIAKNEMKQFHQTLGLLLPYFQFQVSNGSLERSGIILVRTLRNFGGDGGLDISLMIKIHEQNASFLLEFSRAASCL